MALSDTALRVLTEASQHPLRLATPPKQLPAAACNAVLRSLLKGGYVEECPAPVEYIGLGWRQLDGAWNALRVTDAGLLAIGTASPEVAEEAHSASRAASASLEGQQAADAADAGPERLKIFRLMTDGGVQAAVSVARIGSALFWRGLFGGVG